MKVGDLVRYKDWPEDGYGVILKNNHGYILMRFFDVAVPSHELWENEVLLEAIKCK